MAREFLVWNEGGELVSGPHRQRDVAEGQAERARQACPCGTDGQEVTPGRGDFRCGVLSPHGISIQITENGRDVTADGYGT
ncbi:hypothetical protein ACK1X7_07385 [Streptomyces sp. CY1]|uniref:hypothetical protein n=1 Tax=Streptomyces sp. CY1 TaxID=3388313 RepID=UPI0039A09C5F